MNNRNSHIVAFPFNLVQQRTENLPRTTELIGPDKRTLPSSQHIENQPRVGLWVVTPNVCIPSVIHRHWNGLGLVRKAWFLHVRDQLHHRIGLDPHDEFVAWELPVREHGAPSRGLSEHNTHLTNTIVQRLAGFQQERDASPARSVHEATECCIRRGVGVLVHNSLVVSIPIVLTEQTIVHFDWWHGLQHTSLCVTHIITRTRTVRPNRWFHGQQRQHLQQVILLNVPDDAVVVKVPTTALCPKRFLEGDLDRFDRITVPHPFPNTVPKPPQQQILHNLLPEVVIDPIQVLFLEVGRQGRRELFV